METRNHVRGSHFDIPMRPYMRTTTGSGGTGQSHQASLVVPQIEPSMYRAKHPTKEVIQYETSVATVHKLRQFTVDAPDFVRTNSCPRQLSIRENFPRNSTVYGSAFSDPDSNWSRSMREETLRDMQREFVTPGATAMERSKRSPHWPINVPPRFQEPSALQHRLADSSNRKIQSELSHLHVQVQPDPHPYVNRFASPSIDQVDSFNRSYGAEGKSAFERPAVHAVPPASYSSLDMEIRRLQGMITRVEMLREKYKYQSGVLQYPRALPNAHLRAVSDRSFSVKPDCLTPWCTEQQSQRAMTTGTGRNSNRRNVYPLHHDVPVPQMYHPKPGIQGDIPNQWMTQTRGPTMPIEHYQRAYRDENESDGMPKIIDVRSLAQGKRQAVYGEKPLKLHTECSLQSVPSNPRHGIRLSTESRNETGSVESLDSGVDCMSSPTDVQCPKSSLCGYGKVKQTGDTSVRDDTPACIRQEICRSMPQLQPPLGSTPLCISSGPLHPNRGAGPASSPPPLTKTTRKRPSNAATENPPKRTKPETNLPATAAKIPELIPNRPHKIDFDSEEQNDQALDLSLKKRNSQDINCHKEPETLAKMQTLLNNIDIERRLEDVPLNLTNRKDPGLAVRRKSFSGTDFSPGCSLNSCPSGMLHHHNGAASVEDLVALSVKLANEVPQRSDSEHQVEREYRCQHRETRGRFIKKLMRRAEDMLQDRPKADTSNKGPPARSLARVNSEGGEYQNMKSDPKTLQNSDCQKIHSSYTPEELPTKTADSAEPEPKPHVPQNKSPLYIDALVNEALRVFKSPPSEDEMEKQNSSMSFDVPGEKTDRPLCHSPGAPISNREDTKNDKCNIPAAAALLSEPKKSDTVVVSPVVANSIKDQSGQGLEELEPTQTSEAAQKAPHLQAQIKFPDVRVLVRPLKPLLPNPVPTVGPHNGLPKIQTENAVEVPATKQQSKLVKKNSSQSNTLDIFYSAPNFLIPTEDGFRRMQKVDAKVLEIYRVIIHPVETAQSPNPNKQPPKRVYSVYYREMTFPCVLRSDVPFVPTQLLLQDLFPGIKVTRVCKALQQCNILNRYMIRHEQEMLQDQLRRRGITSCKLLPLDEFHDKWEEILHLLPTQEAQD